MPTWWRCCAPPPRASRSAATPTLGEKTLLDALIPMTDTIEEALAQTDRQPRQGRGRPAASAAREAAEATKQLQAKRGRASYTGERSIGSLDAGAMAVAVMAERDRRGLAGRLS